MPIILFESIVYFLSLFYQGQYQAASNLARLFFYLGAIIHIGVTTRFSEFNLKNRFFRSGLIVAIWIFLIILIRPTSLLVEWKFWRDIGFIFLVYMVSAARLKYSYKKLLISTIGIGLLILIRPFIVNPENFDFAKTGLVYGQSSWKIGNSGYGIGTLSIAMFYLGSYKLAFFGLFVAVLMSKRSLVLGILLAWFLMSKYNPFLRLYKKYGTLIIILMQASFVGVSVFIFQIVSFLSGYLGISRRDEIYTWFLSRLEQFTVFDFLFGAGIGAVSNTVEELFGRVSGVHAHNDIIAIVLEHGLLGLVFWLLLTFNLFTGLPNRAKISFFAFFLTIGFVEMSFFAPSHLLVLCYVFKMFEDRELNFSK